MYEFYKRYKICCQTLKVPYSMNICHVDVYFYIFGLLILLKLYM